MAKKKDWNYTEANGCRVGLMQCCSCGKKITEGEFRYYDAGEAYVCQCKACGGDDAHWKEHDFQEAQIKQKVWEERARTEHSVLLQRIKDAFYEGFANSDTGDFDEDASWNNSEAKQIHDVLKALWSVQ